MLKFGTRPSNMLEIGMLVHPVTVATITGPVLLQYSYSLQVLVSELYQSIGTQTTGPVLYRTAKTLNLSLQSDS